MSWERAAVVSVRSSRARSVRCSGAVGSSAKITAGSLTRARARATRWHSARLRAPGRLRAKPPMSRRSSHSQAALRALRWEAPASSSGSAAFSQTFSSGSSWGSWPIQPNRSRRRRSRMSVPMV